MVTMMTVVVMIMTVVVMVARMIADNSYRLITRNWCCAKYIMYNKNSFNLHSKPILSGSHIPDEDTKAQGLRQTPQGCTAGSQPSGPSPRS